MSDDRLSTLLNTLSSPPDVQVACAQHAPLFREDGTLSAAELQGLDDALDCPDCIAVLDAHPYLNPDVLDLPLPPPRVPQLAIARPTHQRSLRWAAGVALAVAAALLIALRTSPGPDPRPGPTHEGASGYAWVEPVAHGPTQQGREQYPSATPSDPETFRFTSLHEQPQSFEPFTGLHEG